MVNTVVNAVLVLIITSPNQGAGCFTTSRKEESLLEDREICLCDGLEELWVWKVAGRHLNVLRCAPQ